MAGSPKGAITLVLPGRRVGTKPSRRCEPGSFLDLDEVLVLDRPSPWHSVNYGGLFHRPSSTVLILRPHFQTETVKFITCQPAPRTQSNVASVL